MSPNSSSSSSHPQSCEDWRNNRKSRKNFWSSRRREVSRMNRNNGGSSRYLRPGALAQLRDARINTRAGSSSCTALGRKRVLLMEYGKITPGREAVKENDDNDNLSHNDPDPCPSPQKKMYLAYSGPSTPLTPKTPKLLSLEDAQQGLEVESCLESLPFELLLRILCLLHHDQLKAVFHVSQRLRKVALVARQWYFNYTTPDRSRQETLRLLTPRPCEHWPFLDGVGNSGFVKCPVTPKAPRHDHRPPSRLSLAEMRQISASLFQGPSSQIQRKKPPGLPRPGSKPLPSHRVLFYEDELCQAVAQNTLR